VTRVRVGNVAKIDPIHYYVGDLMIHLPPGEPSFQEGFKLGVLEMAKRWEEYESNPVVLHKDPEISRYQVDSVESKQRFWEASLGEDSE
jgi:hypothetical protein